MEVTPSVTLIFSQEALLEALRKDNAGALFEAAREDKVLLDIGSVATDKVTRTIVGPPEVMHQIFPDFIPTQTP